MKAIQFKGSLARYAYSMAMGYLSKKNFYNSLSNLALVEIDPPALPADDWVRVKPYYGGICGSDIGLIQLNDSPYTSPFASFPFIIGHENCGIITEVGSKVENWQVGMRVVIDPLLPCKTRGFQKYCPNCQNDNESRCLNFTAGNLSPGLLIGACKDTGGSWSESFVAHSSQVYPIPDTVSWEEAILCDTLASALHPLLRTFPKDDERVLIIGGGPIGLCLIYSLKALNYKGEITLLVKYDFQAEEGKAAGADNIIYLDKEYQKNIAATYGMKYFPALVGAPVPVGGAEKIYDCVGSTQSLKDSMWFSAPGGEITIIGLASFPKGLDWTPIWLKELSLRGFFAYSTENYQGKKISTYQMAMDFIANKTIKPASLLTHTFDLADYKEAIVANLSKGRHKLIKSAFKI